MDQARQNRSWAVSPLTCQGIHYERVSPQMQAYLIERLDGYCHMMLVETHESLLAHYNVRVSPQT